MTKKLFSKILMLALVASVFVVYHTVHAACPDTPAPGESCTSTQISNIAPVLSVQPAESWTQTYVGSAATDARAESSATYPTNNDGATKVRFTATATDANDDQWYLAVCQSAGATAGNNTVPTCTGAPWAVSTSPTNEGDPTYVEYTVQATDTTETYAWYAYACDKVIGGGTCTLANTSQGGINDEVGSGGTPTPSGSPFHVNNRPRFNTVTTSDTGNATIAPDDNVKFKLTHTTALADPDTNASQDTVSMYICDPSTDHFNYKLNRCETAGNAEMTITRICSNTAVNPATTDATCNDGDGSTGLTNKLAIIPTAHADYYFKVYVVDQHGFDATKKVNGTDAVDNGGPASTQKYAVIDVAPFVQDSAAYCSAGTCSDVTLTAGTGTDKSYIVVIKDDNGDADITAATGVLYHDETLNLGSGTCTTADENDCYKSVTCNLTTVGDNSNYSYGFGDTHGGATAKWLTATCGFTVYFNADDTFGESDKWAFHVNPADQIGAVTANTPQSSPIGVNALSALNVKETSIAYGTVALDAVSGNTPQTKQQNFGNQILDVQISGTMMCTDSGACASDATHTTIIRAQQKWYGGSGIDWTSTGFALLQTASAPNPVNGCSDRNLAARDVSGCTNAACAAGPGDKSEDEILYWKIKIPAATISGSYTGTNTFALATSGTCTGGATEQ